MAVAVELGGVAEVTGHTQEALADEERAEHGGQERDGQALVRVEPAELADRLDVRDQRHLDRQHERAMKITEGTSRFSGKCRNAKT